MTKAFHPLRTMIFLGNLDIGVTLYMHLSTMLSYFSSSLCDYNAELQRK